METEQLIEAVCIAHGVGENELYGRRKTQEIVCARQMAMYLMRKTLGMTMEAIAAHFGYHHSTVIHNIAACENDMSTCDEFRDRYNEVLELMGMCASRLYIEQ